MKLPKVDTFLGCMTLETGGLLISWLQVLASIVGIIIGSIILLSMSLLNCNHVNVDSVDDNSSKEINIFICDFGRAYWVITALVLTMSATLGGVVASLCLKGIKNRNHKYLRPMMVLISLGIVYLFFDISYEPVSALFGMIVCGYEYIVLYSLYSKFQDEGNIRLQEAIGNV